MRCVQELTDRPENIFGYKGHPGISAQKLKKATWSKSSGVTIGPADPALQGRAVFGGRQNSTLATAEGQKIIGGI